MQPASNSQPSDGPRSAAPEVWLSPAGVLVIALLVAFGAAFTMTAWVSDDAFITFRTVDNALDGHGLVWNAGERVQTYTHPLWMLLLLGLSALTGEVYLAALALGALATGVTFGLLTTRVASSYAGAALSLSLLLGSRAFVDYASSGLENPLSHALLVGLFVVCARESAEPRVQLLRIGLASLCALTRLDLAFVVLPLLGWAFLRDGLPRLREALLGALPFLLWEAFSLLYYGALIANSARAKLSAGVDSAALWEQGLRYFAASLRSDPLSILLLLAGPVVAFLRRDAARWPVGVALLAHCGWVVSNGGDFMQGRFLTPALLLAAVLLARSLAFAPVMNCAAAALLAIVALGTPWLSPFATRDYGEEWHAAIDDHGVADERHFHREISGLRVAFRGDSDGAGKAWFELPWHSEEDRARAQLVRDAWYADPFLESLAQVGVLDEGGQWPPADAAEASKLRPVLVKGGVGLLGYRIGPGVHLIDYHGLGDPLLSRLPALASDPVLGGMIPRLGKIPWRVGHYLRPVPRGYALSRSTASNRIEDPGLAELYDRLQLVVAGPLLSADRLAAIRDLHTRWAQQRIDDWIAASGRYAGARPSLGEAS